MKIFLAGTASAKNCLESNDLSKMCVLESYYSITEWQKEYIPQMKDFMLDSGAYTFLGTMKGKQINYEDYVCQYADFINEHKINKFFELDLDEVLGLKEVERLRDLLEKRTQKQCIPVWHKTRNKDYYLSLCKDYSYVALGGFAGKEIDFSFYKQALPWFIDTAHINGAKIHGLGLTKTEVIYNYNFDSVDSTTWLNGAKYGVIYLFDGKRLKMVSSTSLNKRTKKDYKENNLHNIKEWLKLCNYAEKWL